MAMDGIISNGAFTGATLAEKLTKLNVSQQSIESILLMYRVVNIPHIVYTSLSASINPKQPLVDFQKYITCVRMNDP